MATGRSCGTCNACCAYYELMPQFNKPHGILCSHWKTGVGCGIYAERPPVCRNFYCHWLQNPGLDDDWRPDRSGIIVRETLEDIPPHWPLRAGLVFEVCGPDASVEREAFVALVASRILEGVPVFLSAHGPMGFGSMYAFLNEMLAPVVETVDVAKIAAALRGVLRQLRAG